MIVRLDVPRSFQQIPPELLTQSAWSSDSEVEAGKAPQAILICSSTLERHSGNAVGRKEGGPDTTESTEVSKLGAGSYVAREQGGSK